MDKLNYFDKDGRRLDIFTVFRNIVDPHTGKKFFTVVSNTVLEINFDDFRNKDASYFSFLPTYVKRIVTKGLLRYPSVKKAYIGRRRGITKTINTNNSISNLKWIPNEN